MQRSSGTFSISFVDGNGIQSVPMLVDPYRNFPANQVATVRIPFAAFTSAGIDLTQLTAMIFTNFTVNVPVMLANITLENWCLTPPPA